MTPRDRIPQLYRNIATSAGAPWSNGRTEVGNDVVQHVGDFFPEIAMPTHKVFYINAHDGDLTEGKLTG